MIAEAVGRTGAAPALVAETDRSGPPRARSPVTSIRRASTGGVTRRLLAHEAQAQDDQRKEHDRCREPEPVLAQEALGCQRS